MAPFDEKQQLVLLTSVDKSTSRNLQMSIRMLFDCLSIDVNMFIIS